ncbi:hypothetical protein STAS_18983 [Striga asiatica]|uniref:Uncharacterized protein n=1 Tax=Striga asiatica TaxID=4170 RepID=A0A5A7QB46_STRAF|nr:hypothetical protein STAS_18983 [Striga asiatica]
MSDTRKGDRDLEIFFPRPFFLSPDFCRSLPSQRVCSMAAAKGSKSLDRFFGDRASRMNFPGERGDRGGGGWARRGLERPNPAAVEELVGGEGLPEQVAAKVEGEFSGGVESVFGVAVGGGGGGGGGGGFGDAGLLLPAEGDGRGGGGGGGGGAAVEGGAGGSADEGGGGGAVEVEEVGRRRWDDDFHLHFQCSASYSCKLT